MAARADVRHGLSDRRAPLVGPLDEPQKVSRVNPGLSGHRRAADRLSPLAHASSFSRLPMEGVYDESVMSSRPPWGSFEMRRKGSRQETLSFPPALPFVYG